MDKAAYREFVIEVIKRSDDQKGFQVLPRRCVFERTFCWTTRWRRLVRDCEQRIDVSHDMVIGVGGASPLRRSAHPCVSEKTLRAPLGRRRSLAPKSQHIGVSLDAPCD